MKTNKIVSLFAVAVVILVVLTSCANSKLVGAWRNDEDGTIVFSSDGTYLFVEEDISGKYKDDGKTLILYMEDGRFMGLSYEIQDDFLVVKNGDDVYKYEKIK